MNQRRRFLLAVLALGLSASHATAAPDRDPAPLLSYSPSDRSLIEPAACYVERILWRDARPGDLPIQQPARYEFVVNLKTAKAIGLTIPNSLRLRADRVIH
jgi:putative ABC transport system substrate-binding protein